jgi:repressor LexA
MTQTIGPRQQKILDFIAAHHARTGIYPSVREIARQMGFASTNTVVYHLRRLEAAGRVQRSRQARSYVLPGMPEAPAASAAKATLARVRRASPMRAIPILGRVAAGEPILAEQNFDGTLDLAGYFDPSGSTFALRVQGDSMIEDGIFDGDFVIVRRQPAVDNGEIGVAIIGDEATVKRIHDDGDAWRLVPANSAMQPIRVPKAGSQFRIAGKVVGVVRKIR